MSRTFTGLSRIRTALGAIKERSRTGYQTDRKRLARRRGRIRAGRLSRPGKLLLFNPTAIAWTPGGSRGSAFTGGGFSGGGVSCDAAANW
jgi:hypothetical protein